MDDDLFGAPPWRKCSFAAISSFSDSSNLAFRNNMKWRPSNIQNSEANTFMECGAMECRNASQRIMYHYTNPYYTSLSGSPIKTCGYLMLLTGLEWCNMCRISTLGRLTAPSSAIAAPQQWTRQKISSKFRLDRAGLRIFGVLNRCNKATSTNLWITSACEWFVSKWEGSA